MNNKIFVAYNTDSIVESLISSHHKKFGNLKKKVKNECGNLIEKVEEEAHVPSTLNDSIDVQAVSDQKSELRKKVFKIIKKYYGVKGGIYELYFDILDDSWTSQSLVRHYEKNNIAIKNSSFIISIIADDETSFWQLQEIYFASYYNKPILYLRTEKFLKLVAKGKLDKKIGRWKKKKKISIQ